MAKKPVEETTGFAEEAEVETEGNVNFNAEADDGDGTAETEDGDGIVVDLSNASENAFPVLPNGIYEANVYALDYSKSQRSGNPMWTWQFEIEGQEDDKVNGRRVYFYTTFNEGGLPRTKKTLARIRADDNFQERLVSAPFNPKQVADEGRLLGAKCRVKLDKRKYEGTWRNEVKDVLAPLSGDGQGAFG
jgi:hypothetical protein